MSGERRAFEDAGTARRIAMAGIVERSSTA
jgi:hypothetical protein